jgi:hypothetical protein
MNNLFSSNGISARRRSIKRAWQSLLMPCVLFISLFVSSCQERSHGQELTDAKKDHPSVKHDSLDKPRVNIKVNKHYDDKGNVIGFDSTYTSFYSNVKGDTTGMDSLFQKFDSYFQRDHSSFFDNQFNTLFFNDSLRYPDFFHKDFFLKRYELNDPYLRDMMNRMDSIKNNFYLQQSKKNKRPSDLK